MKKAILAIIVASAAAACTSNESTDTTATPEAVSPSFQTEFEGEWQSYYIVSRGPAGTLSNGDTIQEYTTNDQFVSFEGGVITQSTGQQVIHQSAFEVSNDSLYIDYPEKDTTVFSGLIYLDSPDSLHWDFISRGISPEGKLLEVVHRGFFSRVE